MDCTSTRLPYKKTGYFSSIITDYLDKSVNLQPFYQHPVSLEGIDKAIKARLLFKGNREVLVQHLEEQYKPVETSDAVKQNILSLQKETTFTITTAHQPALFTGTLYFVYKILHAVKLADQLNKQYPSYHFVPVYWMGSEDADLDELGKFYLGDEKIVWDTKQTGAVGKMNTKGLDKLISRIDGELSVQPFGRELVQLLKDTYLNSPDIQTATFKLINSLFAEYGLLVLIPDSASLKRQMIPVFEEDLFKETPSAIVSKTIEKLSKHHKVQANPREINLFYFKESIRERIVKVGDKFTIQHRPAGQAGSSFTFNETEMRSELQNHPERFSPNVILRGLFQETVLPNMAFIGGAGETAYWLELKDLFDYYKIPFPLLILRNSFLIIEMKWKEKIAKMNIPAIEFFKSEQLLLTELVTRNKNGQLKLANEMDAAVQLYAQVKNKAAGIDKTLQQHVEALQARALKPLQELEKKLLRAEKRKYETEQRQIHVIKSALFPHEGLQERIENFMPYYAKWGTDFFTLLYNHSLTLEQEFVVLEEK
jgi:bacillithiol biosynthesis cysteine-adding enzyme BshC